MNSTDEQILSGAIELLTNKGLERRMLRAEHMNLRFSSILRKMYSLLEDLATDSTRWELIDIREELDSIEFGIENY